MNTHSQIGRVGFLPSMTLLLVLLGACTVSSRNADHIADQTPMAHPFASGVIGESGRDPSTLPPPVQLQGFGSYARGQVEPTIIDTRTFHPQVLDDGPWRGEDLRPGALLPAHSRDKTLYKGKPNALSVGGMTNVSRIDLTEGVLFPGIDQSPWRPPDPSIAVGPDYIVETVNMEIAWFEKETGKMLFQQRLDSTGDPGFFEELDAGDFCFDPKCFYDPLRERFLVLALEKYTGESWITIAVSDDSNPDGVWYKYRTNSIIEIDGTTYWLDYPGLGYDANGWYTTNNLFRLEGDGPGFAGTVLRTFDPEGAMSGGAITYTDVLVENGSHQCAQVFDGDVPTVLVRANTSTSLRLVYVEDALGEPVLHGADVAVPEYSSSSEPPPTPDGTPLNPIDRRILNVMVRNGTLWAGHSISTPEDPRTVGRWYEIDLHGWPGDLDAAPELLQAGEVRPGGDLHTCFPAIAVNSAGAAAIVYTQTSATEMPALHVAGRVVGDALGTLGESVELAISTASPTDSPTYRWGDYFDAAMDPLDDNLFWVVGEIFTDDGWATEIASFSMPLVGDLNGDGIVDGADLSILLGDWGTFPSMSDLNGDGFVDGADLTILLGNWTL